MKPPQHRITYNPKTGAFLRNGVDPVIRRPGATPVIHTRVKGKKVTLSACRLAWTLHHRKLPPDTHYVMFRDGDRDNLRIANLECAPKSKMRHQQRTPRTNSTGHRNVSWHANDGKWRVRVKSKGVSHYFGDFDNLADAAAVAVRARREIQGVTL